MTGRCPTPDKRAWSSRRAAESAAKLLSMRAYRCDCGRFHVTSDAERLPKFLLAKELPLPHEADVEVEVDLRHVVAEPVFRRE